jgi:hypothetical protein
MRRALLLMLLPILLPSCVETTRDVSCMAFRPITVEPADVLTTETARLILGHNRAFEAVCG